MPDAPFPVSKEAEALFGRAVPAYGPLVNAIIPRITNERYTFEALDVFKEKSNDPIQGDAHMRKIYWTEMLVRAHMASVAGIMRTTRWVDAVVREHEAGNLYGWASCCRSLIEAAGDNAISLSPVPLTLAELHPTIRAHLRGDTSLPMTISKEIEDTLIHFTHARKIRKSDTAPDSHKAKQSSEYVQYIEKMNISGAADFYALLCELVHPASTSVEILFGADENAWFVDRGMEGRFLSKLTESKRDLMADIVAASLNAPVLILKVLHKFELFQKIDILRSYNFSQIPIWSRIEKALRN